MQTVGMDKNHPVKAVVKTDVLEEGQWSKRLRGTLNKKKSTQDVLLQLQKLIRLRIYRANIVILVCLPCAIVCFVLSDFVFKTDFTFLKSLTYAFGFIGFAAYFALAYRNISFVALKRLVFQINIWLIVIYATCNLLIDFYVPKSESSFIYGLSYYFLTLAYLLFDCIEIKSRKLVMLFGLLFAVLSLYNLYQNLIGDSDIGVVLITISGNVISKRVIKSFLFMSISMLAWRGFWILLRDTRMKKFMFIYANSLAIKIDPITGVQRTIRTDISITKALQLRVNVAGWMLLVCSIIGISAFVLNDILYKGESAILFTISLTFSSLVVPAIIAHGFRNLSFIALKKLVRRSSLVFLFLLCFLNLAIDCIYPFNSFSPINGCIFLVCVFTVVSLDLMQEKDRKVVIMLASLLLFLSVVNISVYTFFPSEDGKKQIKIFGRTFLKANIKRTIFKQVLTLSLRGLYTLCRDKKMKYIAFSQKRMDRITGTSRTDHVRISYYKARKAEMTRKAQVLRNVTGSVTETAGKTGSQDNLVAMEEQEAGKTVNLASDDLTTNPLAS